MTPPGWGKTMGPCPTCEALARTVMLDQTSHDTKRQWQGLTGEITNPKPTKLLVQPGLLKELGYTVEDVVKMIEEHKP